MGVQRNSKRGGETEGSRILRKINCFCKILNKMPPHSVRLWLYIIAAKGNKE